MYKQTLFQSQAAIQPDFVCVQLSKQYEYDKCIPEILQLNTKKHTDCKSLLEHADALQIMSVADVETDEKTVDVCNSTRCAEEYTGGLYVMLQPLFTWMHAFFLCRPYIIVNANNAGLAENGLNQMYWLPHQNSCNLYYSKTHVKGPIIQK